MEGQKKNWIKNTPDCDDKYWQNKISVYVTWWKHWRQDETLDKSLNFQKSKTFLPKISRIKEVGLSSGESYEILMKGGYEVGGLQPGLFNI